MTAGYAGKILYVNLSEKAVNKINTAKYEEYGGGKGMASALFWDLCKDKTISGFDPENVVLMMTSPLTGTLTPGVGRLEVSGINVFSYPVEWFSRSNIGGFFGTMLKYAGWDGIAIQGKAERPVWINIINEKVTIEDAKGLWGMDTRTTQKEIWKYVTGRESYNDWLQLGQASTTQGPAVLCIGRGGESLSRMGTIQTGMGMAAGQGGFGGVWGSKNLKAISAIGTGSLKIGRPGDLLATRQWLQELIEEKSRKIPAGRQTSCSGCFEKCKARVTRGVQNDGQCLDLMFMTDVPEKGMSGSDTVQLYGLNMNDLNNVPFTDGVYIKKLFDAGVLGPGKTIGSSPLPMEKFGQAEFTEALCRCIVEKQGIGADLAEGLIRAAKKWGRLEQDLASGLLHKAQWGYTWHWNMPFVEQSYGSLLGERDVTEHALSGHLQMNYLHRMHRENIPAQNLVEMLSKKFIPYDNDPFLIDFSWQEEDGSGMKQALETGIYSIHRAKFVAWHRHYTRFWVESMLYCDNVWPILYDKHNADYSGFTPESEPKFYNAVTGKDISFADGMETGRKIWNLDRAIWILQGRHRNMENFAGFMYTPAGSMKNSLPGFPDDAIVPLPVYKDGKWTSKTLADMYLDRSGVEQWKTNFYELEGWDADSGWPTRSTLEAIGLKHVADTLSSAGKIGK